MKWTIRHKILTGFGSIALLIIIQVIINLIMLDGNQRLTKNAGEKGYAGKAIVGDIHMDVVQVHQWLTDISATRGAKGYDDGFREAEKYAQKFHEDVKKLMVIYPDKKEYVTALKDSFDRFYEKGKWMANEYIKGGPDSGNLAMNEFDTH